MIYTDPEHPDYLYAMVHSVCTTCRESVPAWYLMRTKHGDARPNLWVCREAVPDTLSDCWEAHETVQVLSVTYDEIGTLQPVPLSVAEAQAVQMQMELEAAA